jgi:hypothetical protein
MRRTINKTPYLLYLVNTRGKEAHDIEYRITTSEAKFILRLVRYMKLKGRKVKTENLPKP